MNNQVKNNSASDLSRAIESELNLNLRSIQSEIKSFSDQNDPSLSNIKTSPLENKYIEHPNNCESNIQDKVTDSSL